VIQRASERGLRAGATLRRTLDLVREVRPQVRPPVVLFTYANPIARLGIDAFAAAAARSGIDGVLTLDLPLEEAGPLHRALADQGIATIFLLSPTTTDQRILEASQLGRGFLYVISRLGVTGARDAVATGAEGLARRIRRLTPLPLAVGFGLSRPEHVQAVGRFAEAAVVGSALVDVIAREGARPDLVGRVEQYVRWLRGAGPALEATS
jgi:tryptophan synthase alpha chain